VRARYAFFGRGDEFCRVDGARCWKARWVVNLGLDYIGAAPAAPAHPQNHPQIQVDADAELSARKRVGRRMITPSGGWGQYATRVCTARRPEDARRCATKGSCLVETWRSEATIFQPLAERDVVASVKTGTIRALVCLASTRTLRSARSKARSCQGRRGGRRWRNPGTE